MELDVSDWARFAGVQNYAEAKGIEVSEAVIRLVNEGLSHQPVSYV